MASTCACATATDMVRRIKTGVMLISATPSSCRVSCRGLIRTVAPSAGIIVPISLKNIIYSCSEVCTTVRDGGRLFYPTGSVRGTFKHIVMLSSTTRTFNSR